MHKLNHAEGPLATSASGLSIANLLPDAQSHLSSIKDQKWKQYFWIIVIQLNDKHQFGPTKEWRMS